MSDILAFCMVFIIVGIILILSDNIRDIRNISESCVMLLGVCWTLYFSLTSRHKIALLGPVVIVATLLVKLYYDDYDDNNEISNILNIPKKIIYWTMVSLSMVTFACVLYFAYINQSSDEHSQCMKQGAVEQERVDDFYAPLAEVKACPNRGAIRLLKTKLDNNVVEQGEIVTVLEENSSSSSSSSSNRPTRSLMKVRTCDGREGYANSQDFYFGVPAVLKHENVPLRLFDGDEDEMNKFEAHLEEDEMGDEVLVLKRSESKFKILNLRKQVWMLLPSSETSETSEPSTPSKPSKPSDEYSNQFVDLLVFDCVEKSSKVYKAYRDRFITSWQAASR